MVLGYLEIPFDYEHLLRLLDTKYYGAAFSNISRLESMGVFVSISEWRGIEAIEAYLHGGLPVLANVQTGELRSYWDRETSHVVLVIGLDGDQIILNDPAFADAPKQVNLSEFMLAWDEQYQRCGVIGLEQFE